MAENAITAATAETLRSPEEFDDATSKSRPGDTDGNVHVSSITSAHVEWLLEYLEMGSSISTSIMSGKTNANS